MKTQPAIYTNHDGTEVEVDVTNIREEVQPNSKRRLTVADVIVRQRVGMWDAVPQGEQPGTWKLVNA